ncbi:hypothetical protein QFC22_002453 [Naganishia vaughanmartiniae]|uniref:Uncharacterized protein n=1 Tax=Naganishia vaughanmartiniae TaxID=1424756 RepID=A0ACC2XEL2_9TREE|nr:hypothetical protein QFC22_002453 [Naganishia vaughanmartiniae]
MLGRGAMRYRDPERSNGGNGESNRDFGRPRAYDGVPRPERRYQGQGRQDHHRGEEQRGGNGYQDRDRDDRSNRDSRDALHRYASRPDAEDRRQGDASEGDWNAARQRTRMGRGGSRSPVRFTKAVERSPSPPRASLAAAVAAAAAAPSPRRSISPAPQPRRGEMLSDSEEEMEIDQD